MDEAVCQQFEQLHVSLINEALKSGVPGERVVFHLEQVALDLRLHALGFERPVSAVPTEKPAIILPGGVR